MRPQSSRYLCFATAVLLPYIAAAQPQIYVVNYPLQYFAERIAGDHATVVFPAPADVDPAFWQPSVDDVLAYQQADVIFLNGANYAKWLSRVTLPRVKLVDTSAARGERLIAIADQVRHQHGPAGEHSHAGIAFTTWLDVDFAVAQAQVIAAELSARWPRHNATFAANFAQLQDELQTIDQAFADVVQQDALPVLLASHPVYQYFARRYGLDIESVTWEPDVPTWRTRLAATTYTSGPAPGPLHAVGGDALTRNDRRTERAEDHKRRCFTVWKPAVKR